MNSMIPEMEPPLFEPMCTPSGHEVSRDSMGFTDTTDAFHPYVNKYPVSQSVPTVGSVCQVEPSHGYRVSDKGRYKNTSQSHLGTRSTNIQGEHGILHSRSPGLDHTENLINNIQKSHFQEASSVIHIDLQTPNASLDVNSSQYMTPNASSSVKNVGFKCESREPPDRPPDTDNVVNLGAKTVHLLEDSDESKDVQDAELAKRLLDQAPYISVSEDRSPDIKIRDLTTKGSKDTEKNEAERGPDSSGATKSNDDKDDDGNVGQKFQGPQKSHDAESVSTDLVTPQRRVNDISDLEVGSVIEYKGHDRGYHHCGLVVAVDGKDKEKRREHTDIGSESEGSGDKRGRDADINLEIKEQPNEGQNDKGQKYADGDITDEEKISEKCKRSGDKRGSPADVLRSRSQPMKAKTTKKRKMQMIRSQVRGQMIRERFTDISLEIMEPPNRGQDFTERKDADGDVAGEEKKISEMCEWSGDKRGSHADVIPGVKEPPDRGQDVKEEKDADYDVPGEAKDISEKCARSDDKRGSHADVSPDIKEPLDRGQDVKKEKYADDDVTGAAQSNLLDRVVDEEMETRSEFVDIEWKMSGAAQSNLLDRVVDEDKETRSEFVDIGSDCEMSGDQRGREADKTCEIKEPPNEGQEDKEQKVADGVITGEEKISEPSSGEDEEPLPGLLTALKQRYNKQRKMETVVLPLSLFCPDNEEYVERQFPSGNVLILGPIRAGKSSLLNSVESLFKGRTAHMRLIGKGPTSSTTQIERDIFLMNFRERMSALERMSAQRMSALENMSEVLRRIKELEVLSLERELPHMFGSHELTRWQEEKEEDEEEIRMLDSIRQAKFAIYAATAQPMSECSKAQNILGSGQNAKRLKNRTRGGHLNSVRQVNVKKTLKGEGGKNCNSIRDSNSAGTFVLGNKQCASDCVNCVPDSFFNICVFNVFLHDDEDVKVDITADENAKCSQATRHSVSIELDQCSPVLDQCGVEDGETSEKSALSESITESDEIVFEALEKSEKSSDECSFDDLESSKATAASEDDQRESPWSPCFKPTRWEQPDFVHCVPWKCRTRSPGSFSLGRLMQLMVLFLLNPILLNPAAANALEPQKNGTRAYGQVPGSKCTSAVGWRNTALWAPSLWQPNYPCPLSPDAKNSSCVPFFSDFTMPDLDGSFMGVTKHVMRVVVRISQCRSVEELASVVAPRMYRFCKIGSEKIRNQTLEWLSGLTFGETHYRWLGTVLEELLDVPSRLMQTWTEDREAMEILTRYQRELGVLEGIEHAEKVKVEMIVRLILMFDSLKMHEPAWMADKEPLELDNPSQVHWCGKFKTEWGMTEFYKTRGIEDDQTTEEGSAGIAEQSAYLRAEKQIGSDQTYQQVEAAVLGRKGAEIVLLGILGCCMTVMFMLWAWLDLFVVHPLKSCRGNYEVGKSNNQEHNSTCKEENQTENEICKSEKYTAEDDLGERQKVSHENTGDKEDDVVRPETFECREESAQFDDDEIQIDAVQEHTGGLQHAQSEASVLNSNIDEKLSGETQSDFPSDEKRKVEDTASIKDETSEIGNDVSQNGANETTQGIDSHEEILQSNREELKKDTYESVKPCLHKPSYLNWFERVMKVETQEDRENLMNFLHVILDSFDKLPVEMKTKPAYGPQQRKQSYPRGAPYGVHKKCMSRKQKEAAVAKNDDDEEQYIDLHPLEVYEQSQAIRRLLQFSESIPDVRKCQQALIKTFSNDSFMRREVMRCMRMLPRMRNFELLKLLVFRLKAPAIDAIERNLRTFVYEPVYNSILQLMHSGHRKHGLFRKHHHNKPLCKNSDRRRKQGKVNYLYDKILKEDEFVSDKGNQTKSEGFKEITCSKVFKVRLAEVMKEFKLKEKFCNVDGCMVADDGLETDLYETHAFVDPGHVKAVASSTSSSIETKAIRSSYEWIFVPKKSHRKDPEKFGSCVPSVDNLQDLTAGIEGQTAKADATEVKLRGLPDEPDLVTIVDDIPTIPKACAEDDQGILGDISLPEKSKTVEKTDEKFENSDSDLDDGEEALPWRQQDMLPMPVSVPSAAAAAVEGAAAPEQTEIPLKVKVIQPRQSPNDEQIDHLSRLCLSNLAPVKGLKRRERKDAFTDDDMKGIIRNHTWLPVDKLPPPRLDLTHAVVANITTAGLDAIFKQIALGNTPGPATTMKFELLRLCTLRNYPKRNKPYLIRLAASGFYFAADGDEVVCYCCGIRRNGWTEQDVPDDIHKRLSPKCSFFFRNAQVNYPVPRRVDGEVNKFAFLEEFVATNLDDEGEDVTNDFTGPARLQQMQRNGQPPVVTNGSRMSTSSLGIITEQAKHPHYATKAVRLNSYVGWPESSHQEPATLAEAGFYFAGIGDCVRCFFCGVGLRHWAEEDDPWIEHARWSQTCSYLRQYKGEEFINLVHMAIQITRDEEPSAPGTQPNEETTKVLMTDAAQSVLEMGYDARIIRKAIDSILRDTGRSGVTAQRIMEKVLEIEEQENAEEPSREMQQLSLNRQDSTSTTPSSTGASHAQASEGPQGAQRAGTAAEGKGTGKTDKQAGKGTGAPGQDPKRIKEENEKLKEQTVCKICMERTVCIVFLPCGHLVTCAECAPALRKCPICRALVKGTVKTYMS